MNKRMRSYIKYMNGILSHDIPVTSVFSSSEEPAVSGSKDYIPTRKDYERIISQHLQQISFFQHERMNQLIITLALMILTLFTGLYMLILMPVIAILLMITALVFTILSGCEYFQLSKGLHEMYLQYDKLLKMLL